MDGIPSVTCTLLMSCFFSVLSSQMDQNQVSKYILSINVYPKKYLSKANHNGHLHFS